jgi:hypothetical protein
MRKLWAGLLIFVLGLGGCSDAAEETPLSSKTQGLLGDWRLALADVDAEEFAFSYSFARGGSFSNRVGGAFLKRIEELNEIEVFGTLPLVGRLSLPVHEEQLAGDNRLGYSCRVEGELLTLNGESLTLGVGSDEPAGLDPLASEVLRMVSDFALMQLSARDEDEFVLVKVD